MNVEKILYRIALSAGICLLAIPAGAQDDATAAAEEAAVEAAEASADATETAAAAAATDAPAVDTADSTPASQMISEAPAEDRDADATKYTWTLGAGGNIATGNTKIWGVYAGTNFNVKRNAHEFDLTYLFNFSRANIPEVADDMGVTPDDTGHEDTAKNSNLQLRYNYWFTDNDAVYAGLAHRWDEFAGLDIRIRADLGYLRKLWETDIHLLKGEAGIAYIFDNRVKGVSPQKQHNASLRLYLGYVGNLNENVQLLSGLEFLDNLNKLNETPKDIDPFKDVRITWNVGITAKLWEKLAANVSFLLRYDAESVASLEKVDTQTLFSLIYTLL